MVGPRGIEKDTISNKQNVYESFIDNEIAFSFSSILSLTSHIIYKANVLAPTLFEYPKAKVKNLLVGHVVWFGAV